MKTSNLREPLQSAAAEAGQGIGIQAKTLLLIAGIVLFLVIPAATSFGSDFTMKGPREELRVPEKVYEPEVSSVGVAMHGLIHFYQDFISSAGGPDRCGFRPSCSRYGYQAIQEQGPIVGIMMIGDRQTRCNIFKEPGPDYPLLPNGKLYDPVSNNLLFEK
ncbi:MAG TPA: membrane protein insertion efficiency factor YidD [Syntrophales bacterium]